MVVVCRLPGLARVVARQMPEETHDEPDRHAEFVGGPIDGGEEAGHEGVETDAPFRVRLRVEEDLGPHDAVGVHSFQVGVHQIVEVPLCDQNGRALVVDVEEALQVGERVGGADRVDVGEREHDSIARCELEHHLGFERSLDVDVELSLRQAAGEVGE